MKKVITEAEKVRSAIEDLKDAYLNAMRELSEQEGKTEFSQGEIGKHLDVPDNYKGGTYYYISHEIFATLEKEDKVEYFIEAGKKKGKYRLKS